MQALRARQQAEGQDLAKRTEAAKESRAKKAAYLAHLRTNAGEYTNWLQMNPAIRGERPPGQGYMPPSWQGSRPGTVSEVRRR